MERGVAMIDETRNNRDDVLNAVVEQGEMFVITKHNKSVAVILPFQHYEDMLDTIKTEGST